MSPPAAKIGALKTARSLLRRSRGIICAYLVHSAALLFCFPAALFAQAHGFDLWQEADIGTANNAETTSRVKALSKSHLPRFYRVLRLNKLAARSVLQKAPAESTSSSAAPAALIILPVPSGGFERFLLRESPVMDPSLAAQFPELKSYIAEGVDDRTATGRIDTGPAGLRAMVLSATGTFFIDPEPGGSGDSVICYWRSDAVTRPGAPPWKCGARGEARPIARLGPRATASATGAVLRVYRAAIAATGEYTQFHGGTRAGALAAINTTLSRVNAVYEREFCVRLVLVANNASLIYTDPQTDPYTNGDPDYMMLENQANIDVVIGEANYDIGHVFGTDSGGLASLGSVCLPGEKAQGVTGSSEPTGDPFDVDYVCHEIGHQFNAEHTFNATGEPARNPATAFEPGSGSTIMAYAGLLDEQNLQPGADDYFHVGSHIEISGFISAGSGRFAHASVSTGNAPPVIAALPSAFTIPARTPFALEASATDADGDLITYAWEQCDIGASQNPAVGSPDNGASPIFRSYPPTTSGVRYFPSLAYVLAHTNEPPRTYSSDGLVFVTGESLPTTSRTMTFRVSARDNRPGGGALVRSAVQVTATTNAGPFRMTSFNAPGLKIESGRPVTVTWDVANTVSPPVNCSFVKISFSADGGGSFPFVLAQAAPNNGSASIVIPSAALTTAGRLKVQSVGNIFFDINDNDLIVSSPPTPPPKLSQTITFNQPAGQVFLLNKTIALSATATSGLQVSFSNSNPSVLAITGNTATIKSAGSTTITAIQNGNTNYFPAPSVSRTLAIGKANHSIRPFAVTNNVPFGRVLIFTNTNSTANLPVVFQRVSGPVAVTNNRATVTGAGTVVVRAIQNGNTNYNAAPPLTNTFIAVKANQSLRPFAVTNNVPFGRVLIFTNTNSTANLPVVFQRVSGPVAVTNNRATVTGVGTVVVRAIQNGNTNYNAARPLTNTFTTVRAGQTITWTNLPGTNNFVTNGLIPLRAKSSSGLPVTYTSAKPWILQIVGTNAVIKGRGTNTITASQGGNTNFNAAPNVVRTIVIR